jgi:hypothetical protein
MDSLTPDTVNFLVKAVAAAFLLCAGVVSPAAGLVIFSKLAVRLATPQIVKELLNDQDFTDGIGSKLVGSQKFMDSVAKVAEHKAANSMSRLQGSFEVMVLRLDVLPALLKEVEEMKRDIAIIKDRDERECKG